MRGAAIKPTREEYKTKSHTGRHQRGLRAPGGNGAGSSFYKVLLCSPGQWPGVVYSSIHWVSPLVPPTPLPSLPDTLGFPSSPHSPPHHLKKRGGDSDHILSPAMHIHWDQQAPLPSLPFPCSGALAKMMNYREKLLGLPAPNKWIQHVQPLTWRVCLL